MSQPANTVGAMAAELTAAQERVVAHRGGLLRVRGRAGTGKTRALVQRYVHLAAEVGARRVLVVNRDRDAALRFRRAVVPQLAGGFESLAITTPWGLAADVLGRNRRRPRLLSSAEQWAVMRGLLASEVGYAALWPTLQPLVGSRAFVDEVVAAVRAAGI